MLSLDLSAMTPTIRSRVREMKESSGTLALDLESLVFESQHFHKSCINESMILGFIGVLLFMA